MERWVLVALTKSCTARVESCTYAGLFFLAGTLFPVLTWVAFVGALRKLLLRVTRQAINAALFFVFGILLTMRQLARVRRVMYLLLFSLIGILLPALIWLGLAIAVRDLLRMWRKSRLASVLVCRFDTDCPSGYVCVAGRCVPQY